MELVTIVWAVTQFRALLVSIKFTIFTDFEALIFSMPSYKEPTNPKIARSVK